MTANKPSCPNCASVRIIKNGCIHNGEQNHKCKDCGRQFVEDPQNKIISQETKELIDKLLLEKLPLAGIARVAGVSEPCTGLRQPVVRSSLKASREQPEIGGRLSVQCDEVWSFVSSKGCEKWIWLALDAATREIVGVFVGSRGKTGAKGHWRSLPASYRQCAVLYTDFWKAYAEVFPRKRHQAVGKSSGRTNHIERFNCTLRQRTGPEGAALSKTAGFPACSQHPFVLEKAEEPHRCYLDLYVSLQHGLTSLGIPPTEDETVRLTSSKSVVRRTNRQVRGHLATTLRWLQR